MNPEIVEIPSWRYKTIVVIKRRQQTTISNKLMWASLLHVGLLFVLVSLDVMFQLIKAELKQWLIGQWCCEVTTRVLQDESPTAQNVQILE